MAFAQSKWKCTPLLWVLMIDWFNAMPTFLGACVLNTKTFTKRHWIHTETVYDAMYYFYKYDIFDGLN